MDINRYINIRSIDGMDKPIIKVEDNGDGTVRSTN